MAPRLRSGGCSGTLVPAAQQDRELPPAPGSTVLVLRRPGRGTLCARSPGCQTTAADLSRCVHSSSTACATLTAGRDRRRPGCGATMTASRASTSSSSGWRTTDRSSGGAGAPRPGVLRGDGRPRLGRYAGVRPRLRPLRRDRRPLGRRRPRPLVGLRPWVAGCYRVLRGPGAGPARRLLHRAASSTSAASRSRGTRSWSSAAPACTPSTAAARDAAPVARDRRLCRDLCVSG